MKKIAILSIFIWFGCFIYSYAQDEESDAADVKKGVVAAERGDFSTAFKELHPLAEQGNPVAQYMLGLMYARGDGVKDLDGDSVKRDHIEAVKWYRLAAEQGNIFAQSNLGAMYAIGEGVIEDKVLAHMWFNLAASQGDSVAIIPLCVEAHEGFKPRRKGGKSFTTICFRAMFSTSREEERGMSDREDVADPGSAWWVERPSTMTHGRKRSSPGPIWRRS